MAKVKDPLRVRSGKRSKRKGSGQERKLAKMFEKWWCKGQWARTPGSGGWSRAQNREEFKASGDITTTAEDFPFCIEAKFVEGWNLDQLLLNEKCIINTWWAQTVGETPVSLRPLLIFKKARQPEMCMAFLLDKVDGCARTCKLHVELVSQGAKIMYLTDRCGQKVMIFPLKDMLALNPSLLGRIEQGGQDA